MLRMNGLGRILKEANTCFTKGPPQEYNCFVSLF